MPSIYTASGDYSLKADGTGVPAISCMPQYDYAEFSFSGTVTIEVTARETITSYTISPMAKNIAATVNGNKLTFTLSASTYVILKVNDLKKLVIAADPLETDIPASSGPGIYNVTGSPYNADKTGASMATSAIQNAINDAHNAGGGIVYVPAGVYKCGNLTLTSNVTFYLAGGSVIVGTGNGADYSNDFNKSSLGMDGTYFIRTSAGSHDITIRGRGTIDGKGVDMRHNTKFLNNLLVPLATSNFTFDGIIMRDGGFWAFMPVRSDNVTIRNYKGFQSFLDIEDDALDINECQSVTVTHAIALSDDDSFSVKTWAQSGMSKDWPGSVENNDTITFDDCLGWSNCSTFKVGMGVEQLQKNITFKNSYVYQCSRALLISHDYGSPAVQDVTFDNIDIERCDQTQLGPHWLEIWISSTGPINNVTIKNINIRDTGTQTSSIRGNSSTAAVNGVTFSNVYVLGKIATSLSDLNVVQKSYVNNVTFLNSSTTLLSDNFEDGDSAGWTAASGTWSVINDGSKVLNQKALGTAVITNGSPWTDYAYQAEVKIPVSDANAGIIFRVQDSNNYYMYRINGTTNTVDLYKCVNGTLTNVSSAVLTSTVTPDQWYLIKAVVNGNNIKGYVNGYLKTDWTNPITELTSGKVGLRTTSMNVSFDNILVTQ